MAASLLTLSADRIQRELTQLRAAEQAARAYSRHRLWLVTRTVGWYLVGCWLIGLSAASSSYEFGRYALVGGVLVAGFGPLLSLLDAWLESHS